VQSPVRRTEGSTSALGDSRRMNTPTTPTAQIIGCLGVTDTAAEGGLTGWPAGATHRPARWRTMITLFVAKLASRMASPARSPAPPSMARHIDRARAAARHPRAARDITIQARLAEDRRLTGL
jgi:hypothetical protein